MQQHNLPALLLIIFLTCGPTRVPAQCPTPLTHTYRFLNPRVVGYDSQLAPFFLHFGAAYRDELTQPGNLQRRDNLAEWQERFCDQAPAEDIEALVYGNTLPLLQQLRGQMGLPKNTKPVLPPALAANAFAEHLLDAKCVEVTDYLIFAKQCEPFVTRPTDPFAETPPRTAEMESLIEVGLAAFPDVESHYVRLRYAYQLIRLAHYLGAYDYVLELYDYLLPKIDADPSLIYDWIEGHRAGALQ